MKLEELKKSLIEKFFSANADGLNLLQIDEVFLKLSENLEIKPVKHTFISSDPSKAFSMFCNTRSSTLSILEDEGTDKHALFAAVRAGKNVKYVNLTEKIREEKSGDLATVKQALRQAKNLNDEIYFSITNSEK